MKISTALRKWKSMLSNLTVVAMYCKKAKLVLPFMSVAEKYKADKARLAIMLLESIDSTDQRSLPNLRTGRKWKTTSAVDAAHVACS